MKISIQDIGDVSIVALNKDFYKTKHLNTSVAFILQRSNKQVFDMRHVKFFDSSGCGVLLTCLKTLTNSGGDLKLCRIHKSVLTLFELLRIHRIVEIFNTREEAVQSFAD
ncbi:STAS domain-containing protein [Desulfococcaceae bacterium HSG9]|nr:STAS domain-containing protein [Desulfococcaceae bacterium HSG9]